MDSSTSPSYRVTWTMSPLARCILGLLPKLAFNNNSHIFLVDSRMASVCGRVYVSTTELRSCECRIGILAEISRDSQCFDGLMLLSRTLVIDDNAELEETYQCHISRPFIASRTSGENNLAFRRSGWLSLDRVRRIGVVNYYAVHCTIAAVSVKRNACYREHLE